MLTPIGSVRTLTAGMPPGRAVTASRRQRGVFLIEALLGILIFSLGILALIGMQAAAISAQSDARYRIEAANLAEKMQNNIWLNVDRSSPANLSTSLANFSHNEGGANCAFTGTPSVDPLVTNWVTEVRAAGSGLPNATTAMQQILVNTASFNRVTITVCWLPPRALSPSRYTIVTFVN
ncbi:MAG: type IV pilus modification protein PilV [Betaproteobacteria bacterium]|nr:type IV pilus modification protein PilV [Betaproteobacteria bacterium]